jgi:hypothetical protein
MIPSSSAKTYFGKYRGTVVNNQDPQQLGRILAQVPAVLGEQVSSWALPCVPFAGIQSGIFVVPPIGSSVWMEFEQGNPSFPIWTGGFWSTAAQVPTAALTPPATPPGQNIVLQTTVGAILLVSDAIGSPETGGIQLHTPDGSSLIVNATGIYIDNAKGARITLVGPTITFNNAPAPVANTWSPPPVTPQP